jgi:hypothetical protein
MDGHRRSLTAPATAGEPGAAVVGLIVALPHIVTFVRPFNLSHDSFGSRSFRQVYNGRRSG